MSSVLRDSLYVVQNETFNKVAKIAKNFYEKYCGDIIIRDSIFTIIPNYARKCEQPIELFRYPFKDNELWAFTFAKKDTVFLCVNSELPLCKQIFAAAHELYHIWLYREDNTPNAITDGSLLDSKIANDDMSSQEDREANAFAGLLLMPDNIIKKQIDLYDIGINHFTLDDIVMLMDIFALPYKATVLRLLESGYIDETAAEALFTHATDITERIEITGKAKQWQQSRKDDIYLGKLLDNFDYNCKHDLLTDSRKEADKKYLDDMGKILLAE